MSAYTMPEESPDSFTLRGRVYHRIREDILNGRYEPDEELREIAIGKSLGVSRTPVREALRQLELEDLVYIIPNKGAYVKGISQEDIQDIYMIRSRLEGLSARLAAEKITEEQLIAGPQAEGYRAVLPADVTVLSISVTDGTCYVNFDGKLQNIEADITEDVALYAIVDSLTELTSIQRVQIAVNGETQTALRESRRLDQSYVRNLDLVEE